MAVPKFVLFRVYSLVMLGIGVKFCRTFLHPASQTGLNPRLKTTTTTTTTIVTIKLKLWSEAGCESKVEADQAPFPYLSLI